MENNFNKIWEERKKRTEKKYQERSLIQRIYLRLKYQPYYFIKALLYYPINVYNFMIDAEWTNPNLLFYIMRSEWEIEAKWLYDDDDLED